MHQRQSVAALEHKALHEEIVRKSGLDDEATYRAKVQVHSERVAFSLSAFAYDEAGAKTPVIRLLFNNLCRRREKWRAGSAYGIRTRVTAVRGRRPGPLDECAGMAGDGEDTAG